MSCRSTHAGSAATAIALATTNGLLTDSAITSTFHSLKREYKSKGLKSEDLFPFWYGEDIKSNYINQLGTLRRKASWLQHRLTKKALNGILGKIDLAIAEAENTLPTEDTMYAIFGLMDEVRMDSRKIELFLDSIAQELNKDEDNVKNLYKKLLKKAALAQTLAPASRSTVNLAKHFNLPLDPALLSVMDNLLDQASAVRKFNSKVEDTGPRIILDEMFGEDRNTGIAGIELDKIGFDRRNGRVEVVIKNTATGKTTHHAYNNAQYDYRNFVKSQGQLGQWWSESMRSNPFHFYYSKEFEKRAGYAPKCKTCGQFANNKHSCPLTREPVSLTFENTLKPWSRQKVITVATNSIGQSYNQTSIIVLPPALELREAFYSGSVKIENVRDLNNNASGNLVVYLDDSFEVKVNTEQMHCICNDYIGKGACSDIDKVTAAVLERLKPAIKRISNLNDAKKNLLIETSKAKFIQAAQAKVEKNYKLDWARNEEYLLEAQKFWQYKRGSVQYSEDFASFEKKYLEAKKIARKLGAPEIPYMKSNALGGLATRRSGQGFGVELEFDFNYGGDDDNAKNNRALKKIGQELFDAGLTSNKTQQKYHAAKDNGYKTTHSTNGVGNWSFESDGSVAGELVSPTMFDEPETWEKLEKAVEILKRNGAKVTTSVGSHVHVGTGFYNGDVLKYTELARLFNQHEDVTFRLASDPKRGTHRMNGYSEPINAVPVAGFISISETARHTGRNALSFGHVKGGDKDHPEFRLFDGTLDKGAIQSQIKIAVAMTHAAARQAAQGGTKRPKEPLGLHAQLMKDSKSNGREYGLEEDTATFRSLLDTLFTRTEDKDQVLALFANTKWVEKDLTPKRRR